LSYFLFALSDSADINDEISPQRAAELVAGGAQLVDVRQDDEYAAGRIEGSLHIELDQLPAEAAAIDRDRPVVFYCRSGSRSALATQAFRAAGYEAHNLSGGLIAWKDRGLPLEPPNGTVAGPQA
jgi:rhodanese-related sulfurtransferase